MVNGDGLTGASSANLSQDSRMDPSTSTLGAWVRATRLALGINQRELAARAGVSRSYLSDIELGRGVHPSLETLHKLASSLGVSRLHILQAAGYLDAERGRQADSAELRLIRLYRDLSPASRATTERFIQFVHTEEIRWSQASFINEDEDLTEGIQRPSNLDHDGPALFDLPGEPEADEESPGRLP